MRTLRRVTGAGSLCGRSSHLPRVVTVKFRAPAPQPIVALKAQCASQVDFVSFLRKPRRNDRAGTKARGSLAPKHSSASTCIKSAQDIENAKTFS